MRQAIIGRLFVGLIPPVRCPHCQRRFRLPCDLKVAGSASTTLTNRHASLFLPIYGSSVKGKFDLRLLNSQPMAVRHLLLDVPTTASDQDAKVVLDVIK